MFAANNQTSDSVRCLSLRIVDISAGRLPIMLNFYNFNSFVFIFLNALYTVMLATEIR